MIIRREPDDVNRFEQKNPLIFQSTLLYNGFIAEKEGCLMLVSTKGRYALQVMIDLAEHRSDGYIPLKTIADRQDISEKYLESIAILLVRANLLDGVRGKGGGYRLTRSPDQYTVGSVLRLTEKTLAPVPCLEEGAPACRKATACRMLSLWQGLDQVINDYLDRITIEDLMQRGEAGDDYVI